MKAKSLSRLPTGSWSTWYAEEPSKNEYTVHKFIGLLAAVLSHSTYTRLLFPVHSNMCMIGELIGFML